MLIALRNDRGNERTVFLSCLSYCDEVLFYCDEVLSVVFIIIFRLNCYRSSIRKLTKKLGEVVERYRVYYSFGIGRSCII